MATAVVVLTGCAASPKAQAGQATAPASAATSPAPGPAPQAVSAGDPNAALVPAPSPPAPRCPPLVHYAARNAGPLFCTNGKDDPAALAYFMSLHLSVMGLPASASQSQAAGAICADLRHTAAGTEYSAYLLTATRQHWYFVGIAKVHGALSRLCPKS